MSRTDHRHLRLSSLLAAAAGSAARASGLSRHQWILTGLDAMAGLSPLPAGYRGAKSLSRVDARDYDAETQALTLRYTKEQGERWDRAAAAAWLPYAIWATVVVAVLAGVSILPEQIERVKSRARSTQ